MKGEALVVMPRAFLFALRVFLGPRTQQKVRGFYAHTRKHKITNQESPEGG